MKHIVKFGWFSIGLLIALMCVSSCMKPLPILTVTTDPSSIHPPDEVIIEAVCSQDGGTFTLSVEREAPVESAEGVFTAAVDDWPWKATATWTDGDSVAEATVRVTLENETVVAHGLWSEPNTYPDRELTEFDMRYISRGCTGSGEPVFYTGFEDPDGDSLMYHVEIEDVETGIFESVFYGPDRILMGDEYVSGSIFYWFVNHAGEDVLFPYTMWSPMECKPIPTPTPSPGGDATREKRVHVYVLEVECNAVTHWVYPIFAVEPGCS